MIKEGFPKKGGLNNKPSTPRPSQPPAGHSGRKYYWNDELVSCETYIKHLEKALLSADSTMEDRGHCSDPNVDEAWHNIIENKKRRKDVNKK